MFKYVKFAELPVTDQDRAVKFYTEKRGLGIATDNPYQEGWRWIELEIPRPASRSPERAAMQPADNCRRKAL